MSKLKDSGKILEIVVLYAKCIKSLSILNLKGVFMDILITENLKKYYDQNKNVVKALDGVNLCVGEGEFVAIVGTSGSGKSTLLHMLGGLDRPTEGTVYVNGKDIFALSDEELTIFRRRKIGFVFQAFNLVPVLNVYENIVLPIGLVQRCINF